MDCIKEFVIPYVGLSIGNHSFDFKIDNTFFEGFEHWEIEKSYFDINILLEKQENMLVFDISINGVVNVMCDRCLEYFDYKVSGNYTLIVKFGDVRDEENDEILIIPKTESQIGLRKYIYEIISLLLPIKRVHLVDKDGKIDCNDEILRKIDNYSTKKSTDPRWDVLKDIDLTDN